MATAVLPARAGIGLKLAHAPLLLAERPDLDFREVHAENLMVAVGPPHAWMRALRERLSIAGVFWQPGPTKIQGFALDPPVRRLELGWPRLGVTVDLFRDEYRVALLPPELAACLATRVEHVLPILPVLGLGTRCAALALLAMTAVIRIFVHPSARPTHGTWAMVLLYLVARGPGRLSLDHRIAARRAAER